MTINGTTKSDGYPLKVMADLSLAGIDLDGKKIENFSPDVHAYSYLMKDSSAKIAKNYAAPVVVGTKVKISQAASVPGTALITLTDNISGQTGCYAINFGAMSFSDAFEPGDTERRMDLDKGK